MSVRAVSLPVLSRLVRSSLQRTSLCSAGLRLETRGLHLSAVSGYKGQAKPIGKILPEEEKYVVRSPWSEVEIPETNLADFVWQDVSQHADLQAMVCGMTGRSYTYGMAYGMSRKFGSALIRGGAVKGDVLGLVLPNIPEFPIAFLGAVGVGVTVTTMNPTYRAEEIARQLENSGASYVVTIEMFLQNIKQACDIYGKIKKIIIIGGTEAPEGCASFAEMIVKDDGSLYGQNRSCDPHKDIVVLPYSSGTTGPPKGVCLTHFNLVANLCQVMHPAVLPLRSLNDTGCQEITLAVLPFFHIYAMELVMLYCLRRRFKIVTLPKFEPETYMKALTTYRPTFLNLVPPLVSFLATNPVVKAAHLNSGACGCPMPNTIAKVVDIETGAILGPGQQGELCVAGPQVMMGYYRNPVATEKTIVDDWLMTGDIAIYDETRQFTIVDRLKELIKVKGLQVAPSELEDLIRRHPGVLDVAVVGVPDERSGELPRAYIIRKNRNVSEQSIVDYVADRVAPHKKLGAGVMFVDSLPKNQTGKILRRELKAQVFKGSFGY